ncbi:hypothetical protein RND81_02G034300 [Saponaria officinalis]|uniref:Mechanosensitive ion channel MscS domain-containing protein n=1 Tax=Saponaria officinalis TaxID=3572 RepID=A0AAW1MMX9_SAPOF
MLSENQNYSVNINSLESMNTNNKESEILSASFRKSVKVSATPAADDGIETVVSSPVPNPKPLKTKQNTKMTILVLLQVLILLLILGFLGASLAIRVLKNYILGGLEIWKWCLFAMSVLCGFALVLWVYWPVMFLVEKAFALKQEVIYFVYGLRKSGAFFVWWVWVLLMWLILMEQRIQKASPRATKVLQITTRTIISLAVASFAWVLLTIGLRLLSVKCRFNRYIERVQDAAFHLDVLRSLAGKPIGDGDGGFNWCFTKKVNDEKMAENESVRIYTLRSEKLNFMNWDYIFDHALQNLELSALKGIRNISTDEDASKVASFIFGNVINNISPKSECITNEHLSRFLAEDKINLVLDLFSAQESQSIDRNAFSDWVIKVYQDRKKLLQALNDNKMATKQLNVLLRAMLVIMGTIAWLLWIDVLTTTLLAAFLTSLAGGVFIFGESFKSTFQSIMFVFVIHPFDIGDKCIIENTSMVVEQMYILTTVFLNANNEKTYYPNYVLSTKVISNISRSSLLSSSVQFLIDIKTSVEKIVALKDIIKNNFESSNLVVEGSDDAQNNIKMTIQYSYKNNVQENNEETRNRRSEVIVQLIEFMQSEDIKYSFPSIEDATATV